MDTLYVLKQEKLFFSVYIFGLQPNFTSKIYVKTKKSCHFKIGIVFGRECSKNKACGSSIFLALAYLGGHCAMKSETDSKGRTFFFIRDHYVLGMKYRQNRDRLKSENLFFRYHYGFRTKIDKTETDSK